MNENANRPWYREPIMWLVVAIPLSAVLVGAVMLTISISTFDGLVEDDYYKKGMGINQILDRERRAETLGLESRLELDPGSGRATLDLTGNPGLIYPAGVSLSFRHATRSGKDLSVPLRFNAGNRYEGEFSGLEQGKWYLALETEEWMLTGTLMWPAQGNERIQVTDLR